LLGIVKKDGSGDATTYSLGRGNTYLSRFRHASEAEKATFVTEIRANAAAARVKGAVESAETIKKALTKMGMRQDEIMTYRLGGGNLWEACWELFDEHDKTAAREAIRRAALEVNKKGADLGQSEQARRGLIMGLGKYARIAYCLGHGQLYFDAWGDMTTTEKTEATALMLESAVASRGSHKVDAAEDRSLNAGYICASKMHESHRDHGDPAFFSHQFQYHVCGFALQMSERRVKGGWRHVCKMGPPKARPKASLTSTASVRWPTLHASTFFKICPECLTARRSRGICITCKCERN
jgi:hypothetical protein